MLKVMIIEDEQSAMDRYASYVESYSDILHISARAYSSEEALTLFGQCDPDILFTDIRIPGASGLQLASRFREAGWKGELVIISGYDDFSYARKAIQIQASDYLLKPVFQDDFNTILECLIQKRQTVRGAEWAENSSRYPDHILRAVRYVRNNIEQDIGLSETAANAFVSPSYLSSSFHKIMGVTFLQYIRTLRVEMAQELLRNTRLPLRIIGEQCGLRDPSWFNRSFKKISGVSPGKYRELSRENQT